MKNTLERKGRWILMFPDTNNAHFICSECNERTEQIPAIYDMTKRKNRDVTTCPFCGVAMEWDDVYDRAKVFFK